MEKTPLGEPTLKNKENENKTYTAEVVEGNLTIESISDNRGLTIPINVLCQYMKIEYKNQSARVVGNKIEISSPDEPNGITISISAIWELLNKNK